MILTVTPNPALDVTYTVPGFRPHTSHRVTDTAAQAGGKGVNVARVLTALGRPARCVLPLGGPTGDAVRADLAAAGLDHAEVPIGGDTRRTVTIADGTDATALNEPGPALTPAEWDALLGETARHLPQAAVLVLSGSLPPGAPADGYGQLVALGRQFNLPVILDTAGPALLAALPARPTAIKPNAAELTAATGLPDPRAAARSLLRHGAESVLASLGPAGLLAVTPRTTWHCAPPAPVPGNPTGAGDATVAALAAGLSTHADWPAILPDAVALSAATVHHPRAGHFHTPTYHHLRTTLTATHLPH
ncbi:1-phosphofructokinase family hexose kinase [Kitasatospora cineracea]|uniref:1-phosphofructokinase family hexose kinase n=1 Tax=Kitasatospora cineracea TaxID=88074 RepID=UPI003830663B